MSSTFASMAQDVAAIMIIAPRVDTPDNGRQLGETSNPKKNADLNVQVGQSSCLAFLTVVVDEQKGQKAFK